MGMLLLSVCGAKQGPNAKPTNKQEPLPSVEKDVAYGGSDEQMLDLYLPGRKGFMTVVFTYGGGWHSGNRKAVAPVGEMLQRLGYGCALVSHRLAPKHPFPAQAEDVAAAFTWVKKQIEFRAGDPKRVILMGHSSGAHLSLLVATDPKYLAQHRLSPVDIACVVGLSTPVDLEPHEDKKGFGNALMAGKGADVFMRDAALMKAASPIQHVSKDLPLTLLVVGEKDFPMLEKDARAFAAKANGVGREVATFVAEGCDHMGIIRSLLDDRSAVRERVLEFLKQSGDRAR
jgi:acetyl esterase/lipase